MLSAKGDEEEPQHTPYSKLTLAGHDLEGVSIAGQVCKLHQLVAIFHLHCARGVDNGPSNRIGMHSTCYNTGICIPGGRCFTCRKLASSSHQQTLSLTVDGVLSAVCQEESSS